MTDLRALAEAATPGPWAIYFCEGDEGREGCPHEGPHQDIYQPMPGTDGSFGPQVVCLDNGHEADADAAYIAAANPTVVLALLDVVEVARLPRNTYIYDNPEFMGEWVAVPSADFEALRAALAAWEEGK